MVFGVFGKKREQSGRTQGGWTVISGRRGIGEILSEVKVALIIFCSVIVVSAAFIYLYFFGPLAVSRHKAAGLAAIEAGNYADAAVLLENADRYSFSHSEDILKPLAGAYFASKRYEDAVRVIDTLIVEQTGVSQTSQTAQTSQASQPLQTAAAIAAAAEADTSSDDVSAPVTGTADGAVIGTADGAVTGVADGAVTGAADGAVTEAVTALFSDEERHAGVYPSYVTDYDDLTAAYYLIGEAYAYMGDTKAALDAVSRGYGATGNAALLRLSGEIGMSAPVSLTTGSAYNGRFVFHFESIPEGVRTLFTSDGTVPVPGAGSTFLYTGGIESSIGENSLRAVNVNRFGLSSAESVYRFTVFDSAGNINGNIVNGAIAVEWDRVTYFFNGDGIYKTLDGVGQTKLVDGEDLGCLNLLGEWLYFSRYGGADTGVYRVRTDGSGLLKLSDDMAWYMQIADGKMYYVTREGLVSMTPDGAGKTVIAEGGVSHLNYDEHVFCYILEDPDADTVGAGEVYSYDTKSGTAKMLIDTRAAWLQLEGSRLYYTVEGQEEATLLYTAAMDGTDAGTVRRPAELIIDTDVTEGRLHTNHSEDAHIIHDGRIYVFCAGKETLFSMAIPEGLTRGTPVAAEDIGVLSKISSAGILNAAGDDIYAYSQEAGASFGFSPLCVRIPDALSNEGGSGISPVNLSHAEPDGHVEVFGDRLYYITVDGGRQSITEADAETLSLPESGGNGGALLTGIPVSETVVYACDSFVLTSDGANVRLYDIPAGMESGAVVTGAVVTGAVVTGTAGNGGNVQDAGDSAAGSNTDGNTSGEVTGATVGAVSDTPEIEPGESLTADENPDAADAPPGASDALTDGTDENPDGALGDSETGFVDATLLVESKMRQWSGMSKVFEYEGSLYYTTEAGFFRADSQFTKTVFICGDGPKSGMSFKISHGTVLYEQGTLSGSAAGLYAMAVDGSEIRRLFEGDVSAFDYDGNLLYFADARDGAVYTLDISSAESGTVARLNADAGMTGDLIICYGAGGFLARRLDKNYDIYFHAADGTARRLTEGGSEAVTYFNDRLLYASWANNNELRYMDLRALF